MTLRLTALVISTLLAFNAQAKVKVGFLLSTLQEERYQKDKKYFEQEAKRLGADVVFYSSNNSERTQVKKMENLLMKGVDVVVVQPVNSNAASTLVEMAKEEKIPVIAYDRIINNADLDYYVTQDSKKVGQLQAEAAVKATGEKGNYIILSGQSGHSVAKAITAGVLEVLAKYPNIKVVVQKSHDSWSPRLAMATVENSLTKYKGKITAILANNSGMANGAVQGLLDYDAKLAGKVFVAGADADLASIKNLVKGVQQFEVLKDIKLLAETSAQLAVSIAKKEKINFETTAINNGRKAVPVVNTPVFAVTKSKIKKVIIGRGFHTQEAIYGAKK
ncbi:MAG: substrate-binding domain-containing protein [Halobacteriovoraceae bacterium]|jgi:D-xylose transport system substrate-binding protein|nr:substrate-binding domain-containing protein [Halobacteriovoraceae bacterium]MBT5095641.1 substrate-binding domain-containing protein [Halobacteriovoraceae bacterium]